MGIPIPKPTPSPILSPDDMAGALPDGTDVRAIVELEEAKLVDAEDEVAKGVGMEEVDGSEDTLVMLK